MGAADACGSAVGAEYSSAVASAEYSTLSAEYSAEAPEYDCWVFPLNSSAAQPEVNTAAIITAATAANLLIPIPPDTQNAAMQTASPHCFARIMPIKPVLIETEHL